MPVPARALVALTVGWLLTACQPAPEVPRALTDMHGQQVATNNRWLVVNYWATWCKPCREEMPALNQLHTELDPASVRILAANFDQLQGDELIAAAASMDIHFPVLDNPSIARLNLPGSTGLPVTYLVNPEGEFVERLLGEQSYDSLLHALQHARVLPVPAP